MRRGVLFNALTPRYMSKTTAACRRGFRLGTHRRWLAVVAAGAMASLAAAGCSGGGSAAKAAGGGTLTVAIDAPVGVPSDLGYSSSAFNVLALMYEPLIRYGANGQIEPGLATSWSVTDDDRTLTFHLRPGVKFSDGTPLDSRAVKLSFEKWVGKTENDWMGITEDVSSMDTPGRLTFVIQLKRAYYPALTELSYVRPVSIMSPSSWGKDGKLKWPIGTGPFKLQSTSDTQTTLVRNDLWWGGHPSVSRVVFKVISDAQTRLLALEDGQVDLLGGDYLAPMAPEDVKTLAGNSKVKVLKAPSTTNLLLAFNTKKVPALADVRVREAISDAIDRQALDNSLFYGYAPPANGIFPPDIPFAKTDNSVRLPFDPAKARQLLQQAGYVGSPVRAKDGVPLRLVMPVDPNSAPQADLLSQAIQADLKSVGIELVLQPVDTATLQADQAAGKYDVVFWPSFGAPYDPFSFLISSFDSSAENGNGGAAVVFTSGQLNSMITSTLATTSTAQRAAGYDAIWRYLQREWAAAPIIELPEVWAVSSQVNGFVPGPTDYDLNLDHVTVSG